MPAGRELISNAPLSGAELRELMLIDFRRMIESHGLLSNHVAYGRIGYELIVRLHPANATFQDNTVASQAANDSSIKSRPIAQNIVENRDYPRPDLAAVETPPLAGEDADAVVVASKLTREIDSPNRERLREGLPMSVTRRGQDGMSYVEQIKREADPSVGPGNVRIDDDTPAARAAWGLPPEPVEIADEEVEQATTPLPMPTPPPRPVTANPPRDAELERARKLADFFGTTPEVILGQEGAAVASDPPPAKITTEDIGDPT